MSDDIAPETSDLPDPGALHVELSGEEPIRGTSPYQGDILHCTDTSKITFRTPDLISCDGHQFENIIEMIPWIYLAAQARHGDRLAIELLTTSKITILAYGGRSYWPPPPSTPKENDNA